MYNIKFPSLNKLKNILTISFWIVFPAYMVCKFYFKNIPDVYLDFLVFASLTTYAALYSVKSIISCRSDKEFYKKISWLISVYLAGSLIVYFLYLEIFENMPDLIKKNLYLSISIFILYIIFLKIKK
jgi:hypothetical protein